MAANPLELLDPAVRRDPYAFYARGRLETPVEPLGTLPVFLVYRYDDVHSILRDAETWSNVRDRRTLGNEQFPTTPSMLGTDAPEHTRLRGLVNQAFTPRIIRQREPRLREVADQLMDDALARGTVDLVDALTYPLPVVAIAEILGVPIEDRDRFRAWSDAIISGGPVDLFGRAPDPEQVERRTRVRGEMFEYFTRMAEARRREPRDDLLSGLAHAELEGQRLTQEEMLEMLLLLLVAGNETTTSLIGNAAIQFLAHPEALAELRADPERLPDAIEEVLRFDSPVQMDPRRAARTVEMHGVRIETDQTVLCLLGSANRDEKVFERADRFDVHRSPNRHISFGFGAHYCLGANLARLEARIALVALLRRTRSFRLASDEPLPLHVSPVFRGFRSIPVELEAA
jgi:cytochrome P450